MGCSILTIIVRGHDGDSLSRLKQMIISSVKKKHVIKPTVQEDNLQKLELKTQRDIQSMGCSRRKIN